MGRIYLLGWRGPLIKQPLSFSSYQNVLPTANGVVRSQLLRPQHARNHRDGNAAGGRPIGDARADYHCNNGAGCSTGGSGYIQRFNAATNTWSPAADARVPGGSTHDWTFRRLAQG